MAEKRRVTRHRKRLTVRFGAPEPTRLAFSEDIHDSGMFIKTTNVYPPGSIILVSFTLPDGANVLCEAQVMWAKKVPPQVIHLINKSGMGVKFLRVIEGGASFDSYCRDMAVK